MAQNHPLASRSSITLEEFIEYPYLDRLKCEFRPSFIEEVRRCGHRVKIRLQSEREDWIQQLVKSGMGVTSLAQYSDVVPSLALRPISDIDLTRTVSLNSVLGSSGNSALPAFEKMATCHDWGTVLS